MKESLDLLNQWKYQSGRASTGYCALSSDTLSKVRTLTSKDKILNFAKENNFANTVNDLLVLELFQLSNGDFNVSQHAQAANCVILSFRPQGRVSKLRACYPKNYSTMQSDPSSLKNYIYTKPINNLGAHCTKNFFPILKSHERFLSSIKPIFSFLNHVVELTRAQYMYTHTAVHKQKNRGHRWFNSWSETTFINILTCSYIFHIHVY